MKIHLDRSQVTIEMERELVTSDNLKLVIKDVQELVKIDLERREKEFEIDLKAAMEVKKSKEA